MPSKAKTLCHRCNTLRPTGSYCPTCNARRNQQRGTAAQRGYGAPHRRFRAAVLARDPLCVLCLAEGVETPSVDADHFPQSRSDLIASGNDPNDPAFGRGLCGRHHRIQTMIHQGGGFGQRPQQ